MVKLSGRGEKGKARLNPKRVGEKEKQIMEKSTQQQQPRDSQMKSNTGELTKLNICHLCRCRFLKACVEFLGATSSQTCC